MVSWPCGSTIIALDDIGSTSLSPIWSYAPRRVLLLDALSAHIKLISVAFHDGLITIRIEQSYTVAFHQFHTLSGLYCFHIHENLIHCTDTG